LFIIVVECNTNIYKGQAFDEGDGELGL
ncbi:MAG: hypothetical protein ACI9FJ_003322, partial [Alteromonadaceae bacterium]